MHCVVYGNSWFWCGLDGFLHPDLDTVPINKLDNEVVEVMARILK